MEAFILFEQNLILHCEIVRNWTLDSLKTFIFQLNFLCLKLHDFPFAIKLQSFYFIGLNDKQQKGNQKW